MKETIVNFDSLDGIKLQGSLRKPPGKIKYAVLLVHGITVDRNEDGFYTKFATNLEQINAASLRFDLRSHGKSEGKYEELTLTGVMNDIGSALKELKKKIPSRTPVSIIAASFGGGLSAYWVSEHPNEIKTLVLLNPVLNYGQRMLYSKSYWSKDHITTGGAKILQKQGWLHHGSFRMGRALINELFYVKPFEKISDIMIPILTIHGDKDSMVPINVSKKFAKSNKKSEFMSIKGADHGFTNPDDEDFTHPNTLQFRSIVFNKVLSWINKNGR